MTLLVVALGFLVCGAVAALIAAHRPALSSALAVVGATVGGVLGEVVALRVLLIPAAPPPTLIVKWEIPYGQLHAAVDPLSAFFLVPVFGFPVVAAIYGRAYMASDRRNRATPWFAFNMLVASMVCVVIARQAVLFLVAWEVMSLCAYLLITHENDDAEVGRAGWVYLLATHVGTAFLLVMFMLFGRHGSSFDFDAIRAAGHAPVGLSIVLFLLAVLGFGVKAGVVPLHVWLPEAHAAAPSHVSALMSAVLIKLGIYGLLRVMLLLGRPAFWWGPTLMVVGLTGGVMGISLALYQRDLKRVLAYSSVENVGIILLGIGVGLWGVTSGHPLVATLGITGGLLHIWNHTLMKGLLFLAAGSVVHGCGTKDLERLGGVAKTMPRTATAMITGAVAIAALPPMNGFVSEWLVYVGLIQGAMSAANASSVIALLAVGVLSGVGALTVLCFVRLSGIALLGQPRTEEAATAHESRAGMTVPILFLAALSVGAALLPQLLVVLIAPVTAQIAGIEPVAIPSLGTIATLNGVVWILIATGLLASRYAARTRATSEATWGCGYPAPTARMQYTARSFAELVGERFLPRGAQPRVEVAAPMGLFPSRTTFSSTCADPVTRGVYEPFLTQWGNRFARLRWLQQGVLHAYVLYIVVAAIGLLTWISLRSWIGS